VTVLGNIPETEIYQPIIVCDQVSWADDLLWMGSIWSELRQAFTADYLKAFELNGIKIIRYEESVYYANVDNFKYQVLKIVGIKPEEYLAQIKSLKDKKNKTTRKTESKKKQNKVS
jgi:hypothetical protein